MSRSGSGFKCIRIRNQLLNWIRNQIANPDTDPETQSNPDPYTDPDPHRTGYEKCKHFFNAFRCAQCCSYSFLVVPL